MLLLKQGNDWPGRQDLQGQGEVTTVLQRELSGELVAGT